MSRATSVSIVPSVCRVAAALAVIAALVGFGPATVGAQAQKEASAAFTERNNSGISGTAVLKADGDRTSVTIEADGALGDHPTHIHQGTCADLDPNPKYPLRDVELRTTDLTGLSDTTVDVSVQELLETEHLILIHKSAENIGTYYACGDIVPGIVAGAQTGTRTPSGNPLARTGIGSAVESGRAGFQHSAVLGAIAAVVAASALVLRVNEQRGR